MKEFVCLAECNRLIAKPVYVDDELNDEVGYENFIKTLLDCVHNDDRILVVSYYRKTLGQSGWGHFSPIGAFDSLTNKVLIMDVARFKYPPHWVDVKLLWEAMRPQDHVTKKRYCVLRLRTNTEPLAVFRLMTSFKDIQTSTFAQAARCWMLYLKRATIVNDQNEAIMQNIQQYLTHFASMIDTQLICIRRESHNACCATSNNVEHSNCCVAAMTHVNNSVIHDYISNIGQHLTQQQVTMLTILFLSWPFELTSIARSNSEQIQTIIRPMLTSFTSAVLNDLTVLRIQLHTLLQQL